MGRKPADASARASGESQTASPSAFSTVIRPSAPSLTAAARAAAQFLASAVNQSVPVASDALSGSTIPGTPLLVACALLTLARIMRTGARMQDDLAGTV